MREPRATEVIYQVYPSSFKDTTGDGLGDLNGITEKLDYIKSIGVDALWISPFFLTPKGPDGDGGYAITDYRKIDPKFGSINDFKVLLDKAHEMGIRVYTDFVLSHTASDHEWFQKSLKKEDPFSDYFVWHDGHIDEDGNRHPPNNWKSVFGGEAWTWHDERQQYYMHHFLASQPALNHNAEKVQKAIIDEMKFWLDMGVDGFRLDALPFAICDKEFRNNPWLDGQWPRDQENWEDQYFEHSICQTETIDLVKRIRQLMDGYSDRKTTLGEAISGPQGGGDSVPVAASYVDKATGLDMCYTNALMGVWQHPNAEDLENMITYLEDQFKTGGNCNSASNHDIPRSASRMTKDTPAEFKDRIIKQLMQLFMTLPGSFCMYQGEELGLPQGRIPEDIPHDQLKDPVSHTKGIEHSRDGARTPMPWQQDTKNAGFSSNDQPYLPVPKSHLDKTVEQQEKNSQSMLNFTRDLTKWRKQQPALINGTAKAHSSQGNILSILRQNKDQDLLCIFNLSAQKQSVKPSEFLSDAELETLKIDKNKTVEIDAYSTKFYGARPA